MITLKVVISAAAVFAGLLSGAFWVKAAYAKVPAENPTFVGSGFDGVMNVRDETGEILDFRRTFTLQSKWNSRAALASAAAAVLGAISFMLPG
jgi:hypothetical protein